MYQITNDMSSMEMKKYSILNRIERLERENDRYIADRGVVNFGIYNKIQELYDEIDKINREANDQKKADRLQNHNKKRINDMNLMMNLG